VEVGVNDSNVACGEKRTHIAFPPTPL
jgi:hypothetical protein